MLETFSSRFFVLDFLSWSFEFVSDFEFRISNLPQLLTTHLLTTHSSGGYQPQASSEMNWLSCRWNPGSSLIW
jgi:hypothetical protein